MKHILLIILLSMIPILSHSQSNDSTGRIRFALNSSINGEVYPIRLVPTLTYIQGNSQFELGGGIHPFIRKNQKIFSGELNYKYFPNGKDRKFNMYLIGRFSYIHNSRSTYYPSRYNYLFLNGGYGFQINASKKIYLGTNFTIGTFTYGKQSEIPYDSFKKKDLFKEFGFNLAFQFNIGFRF